MVPLLEPSFLLRRPPGCLGEVAPSSLRGLRSDVTMGVFFKYQNTISALPSSHAGAAGSS